MRGSRTYPAYTAVIAPVRGSSITVFGRAESRSATRADEETARDEGQTVGAEAGDASSIASAAANAAPAVIRLRNLCMAIPRSQQSRCVTVANEWEAWV
jgi:hypothetical protein